MNIDSDLLYQWTYEKIKSNPKLFGGDKGNPAIILEYLQEMNFDKKINDVSLNSVSNSVWVSRAKNLILEEHQELDFRKRHRPKKKNKEAEK